MSSITIHYCDLCGEQIKHQNELGENWSGHIKYRIYTPDGQKGEKIELCAEHAAEVYRFIKSLR